MFTGLIEELGRVVGIEKRGIWRLDIAADLPPLRIGASIAVNGACLTVVYSRRGFFSVEVMKETLERTNISLLKVGDLVNLERPLRVGDRFEGHFVLGHVDCMGKVSDVVPEGASRRLWISIPDEYSDYLVPKGSIAVDGVSLTIASVEENAFSVALIPHTLERTNLSKRKAGDLVNLEFDILGKYICRMLGREKKRRGERISLEFLKKCGFA